MHLAGGGSFTLPPTVLSLTDAGEGGWNQQSDYKAVHYNGRTYFGWINTDGDIKIATYINATGEVRDEFTLHAALQVNELHPCPVILVREPDHKLVVAYTQHDTDFFVVRISTNAEDTSAWGAEIPLDATLGGEGYTYPTLIQRASQTIVMFYRDYISGTDQSFLSYTYSTNGGTTWAAQTHLYVEGTRDSYWKISGEGERIDVAIMDGHPVTDAPTKVFHMYADAVNWYTTDGTLIAAGMPFDTGDMTQVYDGADGSAWLHGITRNGDGNPVMLFKTGIYGAGDWELWRAHWDGSDWITNFVVDGGGPSTFVYAPGDSVLDDTDPDIVYAALYQGDVWEMYKLLTDDDGETWSQIPLTSGSSLNNVWPATVHNRGTLKALWLYGTVEGELETGAAIFSFAIHGTTR